MQAYLPAMLRFPAEQALWFTVIFFLGGMLSAAILRKNQKLCRAAGLGFAALACISLFLAGLLALLGHSIEPITLAEVQPIGSIGFGIDALSGFFALLIGIVGFSISVYSSSYLDEYVHKGYSIPRFIFLFNMFLLSMAMVVAAQNAVAFLVFWEIMAVSSYYLVSFEHREDSAKDAGLAYLLMAHFGTACLIIMFLALAGSTAGSMDFGAFVNASYAPMVGGAIFVLALVGFGAKAGIMPFHIWLPIAHPRAPSNISALMSGVMLKVAVYGIIRVVFGFLSAGSVAPPMWWGLLLLALGAISAVLGVLYSLTENDIKTLLAYSSIENIGIIFMGIGGSLMFLSAGMHGIAAIALFAAIYHALNHALFKSLLFSGAGAVIFSTHTRNIDKLGGLIKRMPVVAFLFFIGAASIAAIPPLNGFASEWLTFTALLGGTAAQGVVPFAAAAAIIFLALTSAFAVAAFVKAFGITFLGTARSESVHMAKEAPKGMLIGMAVLAIACVAAGIFPGTIAALALPALVQLKMADAGAIVAAADALPTLAIFAAILVVGGAVFILLKLMKRTQIEEVRGPTWGCGIPSTNGHMQYSAKGFTMPILRAFDFFANPRGRAGTYGNTVFETLFYGQLKRLFLAVSPWSRKLHTGKLMHYLLYLMVTLVAVIAYALA